MKNYILILTVGLLSVNAMQAQILTNSVPADAILNSNAFLDASTNYGSVSGESNDKHKGLVFPDVNLVNFQFEAVIADGATFPSYYDGMVVYNKTAGTTLTTGNRSSTATVVVPGFYYFSNPNGAVNGNVTAGKWLPVGSSAVSVKSKEVLVTTPAVYNEAKLDLGTSVIGASEVGTFLGAKIYEAGKLIMTADSDYVTTTNVLTTGNGYMFQLLKANTQYKVVVEYK